MLLLFSVHYLNHFMLYLLNKFNSKTIAGLFFLLIHLTVQSQSLPFQQVEVTVNKTSSIVFPVSIASVDRGSHDVLAQKAKGVTNVLQIKAGTSGFGETNLTVITADRRLHHFLIHYAEHPASFITLVADSPGSGDKSILFDSEMTEAEMEITSADIIAVNPRGKLEKDSDFDMKLMLNGIYIHNNVLFFHLKVRNKSNIPFHTDMLRFSIKDKQKIKRMASQEVTENPLYVFGNATEIDGKSSAELVYAIPKFTIPDAKLLTIELMEKRGGRHLHLSVKNKTIVKARAITK